MARADGNTHACHSLTVYRSFEWLIKKKIEFPSWLIDQISPSASSTRDLGDICIKLEPSLNNQR